MKKSKKIIAILMTIAVMAYVIYAVYMLIVHPTRTYIIKEGTITEEDESIGYIIREEKTVKGENYNNGIYAIASEGQRVAVGESIFRYYSDSEKEIKTQISALNYQIQNLLEQEKGTTSSADIKSIEKQTEEKIKNLNSLNNYQEIIENKKNIDNLITKKINFIGNVTENKEIKGLIGKRKEYEEKLKKGSEYQKAPIGGVVSYRVDGLEDVLSVEKFDEITEDFLDNLDLKTGKIVSTSNESGKVIDNFKCYIAIPMESKNAMEAKVGDKLKLRISNTEEIPTEIKKINEGSGKRVIIFEIDKMPENLTSHRKIVVDVIWWNASGLKIPKKALVQENGLNYVLRNKAGVQTKILVKVKIQTEKFVIIESYNNEELKEMGYNESQIKNYKKITNYDEIIIQ